MNNNSSEYEKNSLMWLIGAAIATVFLWQLPKGDYILYPFSILATWFHEMGHGLTAIILGGSFSQLMIFADGSGLAFHSGPLLFGPIGRALVAAGGPMGPPLAGALLIMVSRPPKTARLGLMCLGSFLLLSVLIWVRSLFGLIVLIPVGIIMLLLAQKAPSWLQTFSIQFLGMQACISTYHQIDYLFTYSVTINGNNLLSDTGQIAKNLLLPYWFWGSLMVVASLLILIQSLRFAYFSSSSR